MSFLFSFYSVFPFA
jgi:hypothetical protein